LQSKPTTVRRLVLAQRRTPAAATRPTRAERVAQLRLRIVVAAAALVEEFGYAGTTITRIVEKANIAQGTFYLYFASRQALFNQLLPHFGEQMIAAVSKQVSGATNFLKVDKRGFVATIDFPRANRGSYSLLNDAQMAAPIAHRKHTSVITAHYARLIKRDVECGRFKPLKKAELEVMVHVFESARTYLYMRHLNDAPASRKLPAGVVRTYMTLVRSRLQAQAGTCFPDASIQ